VFLAYLLSAILAIDVTGIWWLVPIEWAQEYLVGLLYYKSRKQGLLRRNKKTKEELLYAK